ncbi:MAG TPA: SurA N-terminal domain-containing protein [Oceanobacillus sp.]|nr:SurA N-terminal domain-containing protein [Oceanobacillus sp.]
MSKRGQTGGQPPRTPAKPSSRADATAGKNKQPRLIREYKTKAEREAVIQRYIILITAIVLGIAALVLIVALAIDQFVVPGQPAAQVNDEIITIGEFQRRVRLERALINIQLNQAIAEAQLFGIPQDQVASFLSSQPPYSIWLNEIQVPDQLGNRVLNEMIDNELIRQRAAELGLEVTPEDVQEQINEFFGYDPNEGLFTPTPTSTPTTSPTPFVSPTPTNTPTATATPELTATATFTPFPSATPTTTPDATQRAENFTTLRDDYYSVVRRDTGLSDEEINQMFEEMALRKILRDHITADLPRTVPFVNVRLIAVDSEERAQEILVALQAGEPFAELAQSVSTDSSNVQGGELGWQPESTFETNYGEAVATALSEAEIGALIGPIQSGSSYYILQLRGREDREQSDEEYEAARDAEAEQYVDDLRDAEGTNIQIYDTWLDYVPEEPVFIPRFQ